MVQKKGLFVRISLVMSWHNEEWQKYPGRLNLLEGRQGMELVSQVKGEHHLIDKQKQR